jgi:hypothetical protein
MQSASTPQNMSRAEAASYLRETHGIPCSPAMLANYACFGGGPPFRKVPIYSRDELDSWAERSFGGAYRFMIGEDNAK